MEVVEMYGLKKVRRGWYRGKIGRHIYDFKKVGSKKWIWERSDGDANYEKFSSLRDAIADAIRTERAEEEECIFYTWC